MTTVAEIFEESRSFFGRVPRVAESYACRYCVGPVSRFEQCYACHVLFDKAHARQEGNKTRWINVPTALSERVVPITSVLTPSIWYTHLATFKRGQLELYGPVIVSLIWTYLTTNEDHLSVLLGGHWDQVCVVPSKKGHTYATQPLVRTLRFVEPLRDQLRNSLTFESGNNARRFSYTPNAFGRGPDDPDGKRIVLIEDAWVTGATAISAAGALLNMGAAGVVVLPTARVVDAKGFWGEDHPYVTAMKQDYDPAAWPR